MKTQPRQLAFTVAIALFSLGGCAQPPHTHFNWGPVAFDDTNDQSNLRGVHVEHITEKADGTKEKIKFDMDAASKDSTAANAAFFAAMAQAQSALINKIPNVAVAGFTGPPTAPAPAPAAPVVVVPAPEKKPEPVKQP